MTVGNVAALTQTNMKRLLAYSSIAHAGYIMMGVVALSENGARGMMIYLLAYLFMNLGAFLVVTLIHYHDGTFDLRDYPGLHRRAPLLTVAMAVFLLSLMGIPPLVGFMGKLYVFAAVIERGPDFYWYAVVAALNAAMAAYYYARVLKTMIIDAGQRGQAGLHAARARPARGPVPGGRQRAAPALVEPGRGLGAQVAHALRPRSVAIPRQRPAWASACSERRASSVSASALPGR